jgi:DNA primase
MPLPARFLDDLRARLPLSAFIGQHVPVQRTGREWKACCPFHKEKTPSFTINDTKGFYHCFGCGAHGDVIGFAMNHLRWSFPEAVENLAQQAGLPVPQRTQETKEETDKRTRLFKCLETAAEFFTRQLHTQNGKSALSYLQGRQLDDETIAAWRLGFAPDDGSTLIKHLATAGFALDEMMQVGLVRASERNGDPYSFFRGRVIFPVTDARERVVAFGARLLQGDGPKYINSPEHSLFKKGELVFGAAMARRVDQAQPLVLCEGYMDVIALWAAGFAAVAPMGTALTETQLATLWRQANSRDTRTPVLCFDGDNAGLRAAARALTLALPHLNTTQTLEFVFLPQGDDPDSLIRKRGADAFTQLLAKAMPVYDVLWQQAVAGRTTTSPEARAALESALAKAIAPINDPTLRRYYERETKDRLWKLFNNRRPAVTANNNTRKQLSTAISGSINSRTAPLNADLMRAQIVLATLINHPGILAEAESKAEEWLLAHILPTPEQENIRTTVLEYLQNQCENGYAALDAEGLKSYIQQRCGATALSAILNEGTYRHAAFARPDRALDDALVGWHDLQQTYTLNRMRDDMQAVSRDLAHQFDETSLMRMAVLQAELAVLPDALSLLDSDGALERPTGSEV